MTQSEATLAARMQQIDAVLADVEKLSDPLLRERIRTLIRTLLDFYTQGLSRIVQRIEREKEMGSSFLESLAQDELVGSLLVLHGLHPAESDTEAAANISLRPAQRVELPLVTAGAYTNPNS